MRFADKLAKLRKNNNLSQELLADKMNMSRQAISKWESGSSYPDMDKMLQLCKILNCNLEDLMDDGVIGNSDNSKKKFDFNKSFQDFLSFITRSYNMFCSMKFKEKIKLIFELLMISLILFIISITINYVFNSLILNPILGDYSFNKIRVFIEMLLNLFLTITSIIVFLHLYKIRYLDYYITVEDNTIKERIIEEPIEKKENKYYIEPKHEKVIIRDPKHTSFSFFNSLGKILLLLVKVFLIMCAFPLIFALGVALFSGFVSLYHTVYNVIFLWIFIGLIGLTILMIVPLNFIYNFIFNQDINFKRNFKLAIVSLILICLGGAFTFIKVLNLNFIKTYNDLDTEIVSQNVTFDKYTNFFNIRYYKPEIVIDNSLKDMKIEVEYIKPFKHVVDTSVDYENHNSYIYIRGTDDFNPFIIYKMIIKDLKSNIIRFYEDKDIVKVKITVNSDDYNILKDRLY